MRHLETHMRAPRRLTSVDWPSFILGGGAGGALVGLALTFGLPDPQAIAALTVTPEAATAAAIAAVALAVAFRRPQPHRTPVPGWRHSSPCHARTGVPAPATVPDAGWEWMGKIQPMSGSEARGTSGCVPTSPSRACSSRSGSRPGKWPTP